VVKRAAPDRALTRATPADARALLELRERTAAYLAKQHGRKRRASRATIRSVLWELKRGDVIWVLKQGDALVASLVLGTRKPWSIDASFFAHASHPIYLTSMNVAPEVQRQGVGRLCLEEAKRLVREWPGDAIRLDAFDRDDGAGDFYRKCGFREVARVRYRGTPLIYFELGV
jgi:ribosomal protein S18 acetylase RimI-like enzyme